MEKIRRVKVKDFQEDEIPLVPYTEDVMGDGHETTVRNFMKLYAREYPETDEAMEDGVHTFEECWKCITEYARRNAKDGCAALTSDTVFRLAANYYLSPVVEEEKKEEPKAVTPVMQPSWDSEEARKAREEAEAKRREEERRKRIEEDVKRNGALLFDFC